MSWKLFFIQSVILIGVCYLAIHYFQLKYLNTLQLHQEETTTEIHRLENRIDLLEQDINLRITQIIPVVNSTPVNPLQNHTGQAEGEETVLQQRIKAIEEKEKVINETIASLQRKQEELEQEFAAGTLGKPRPVQFNWLSSLPDEKRLTVQEIFKEQTEIMADKIFMAPGTAPPGPKEVHTAIQENHETLKIRLKEILDHEEYNQFLKSLPEPMVPPATQGRTY